MKKLILLLALGISLCANAQITVVKSGQTRIGNLPDLRIPGTISPNDASTPDAMSTSEASSLTDLIPQTVDNTASLNIWGISNPSAVSDMGSNMGHITFRYGNYANIAGNSATGYLRLHARSKFALVLGKTENDGLTWNGSDNAITSTYNMKAPSFLTTSDFRLKKNIGSLNHSYVGLLDVNPVSYNLTTAMNDTLISNMELMMVDDNGAEISDERTHFGFIAQEVQKIYPNLVVEDEEGMLAIDYTGFIPLLVEAYKDLAGKVKEQEEVIDALLGQKFVKTLI